MVSSRQSKSVSKAADSRSLRRCLDLGDIRDQLRPKLARLLRSPREFCRNICGLKAGEDWKYGSPPLGSSSPPPLQALLYVSCGCSLSFGQWPRPRALNTLTLCALVLSPLAQPLFRPWGVHLQCPSSPFQLQNFVSIVLFAYKHGSVPT